MDDVPSYQISINADDWSEESADPLLCAVAQAALRRHSVRRANIEIAIVSDRRIAELNERFLAHQGPTDVLTFDLSGAVDAADPDAELVATTTDTLNQTRPRAVIDGQIIVSHETARREAHARGHSVQAELALYVVHGVLHLLGYDDHDETDARRMHELEDELLQEAGAGPVFEPQ